MDDPLKSKIFQSPQEGASSLSQPVEQPEPPALAKQESVEPVELSQEPEINRLEPESQKPNIPIEEPAKTAPFQSYEPAPVIHTQISPENPSNSDEPPSTLGGTSAPRFSTINIVKLLIGLFAVLIVLFAAFTLVIPNLGKKPQTVELTFWDNPDNLAIASVLPEFEKENPNIKIDLVKQDYKDYKDKLITRINNGNGPDMFRFHNTWVLQLSSVLLPIPSNVITKNEFNKTFYPVASHDLIKNGAIYGIPVEINTLSLFVNSAMLKQANVSVPTNWNDFVTASRALTLKDQSGNIKVAGAAMGTFDNITHAPDIISMLFAQDGVNLDDISQSKKQVSDALNFYTGFAQGDGAIWDPNQPSSIISFSKGTLAMVFGYQKDVPLIKSANPNLSFNVVNVPYLTAQNKSLASYYPIGISLRSRHQKEALIFLKFLAQRAIEVKLTSLPSARVDLPDQTNGEAKNAVSSYFSGETFDNGLNTQMNTHLSDAVSSILSGNSPDTATDSLILGFSQVLGQLKPTQ